MIFITKIIYYVNCIQGIQCANCWGEEVEPPATMADPC